jgi:hypothetical protein
MRKIMPVAALFCLIALSPVYGAEDYQDRFVKNYPPGFYGMWYKAERFYRKLDPDAPTMEKYRWDRYMSRITNVHFPFLPVPYDWEYGNERTFNLPDYGSNDWR